MFKLLSTSMFFISTFAQTPLYRQNIATLKNLVQNHGPSGGIIVSECDTCYVPLCDTHFTMPDDISCIQVNTLVEGIRDSLFKPSTPCKDNGAHYTCDVFVKPAMGLLKEMCRHNNNTQILKNADTQSYCEAKEHCPDLSRCVGPYNIDCEYDSEILPHINQFYDLSEDTFTVKQCPNHHDKDKDGKVKQFFEDYWQDIVISSVISAMFSGVIIIIIICRKVRVIVQERSIV